MIQPSHRIALHFASVSSTTRSPARIIGKEPLLYFSSVLRSPLLRRYREPAILMRSWSIDGGASFENEGEVSLSDDMLAEIILRMPLKSVARSRCVSKSWCATISDEYLRRRLPLHMSVVYFHDDPAQGSAPRYACAGDGDGRRLEVRDLGFLPSSAAVVCDGCNGLLLCRSSGAGAAPEFIVSNPVTRRWAALPPPAKEARLSVLAFDPLSSPHYHVVNFTGWRERGAAVEVFSSAAWEWAARGAEFGVPAAALSGNVHYHDGVLYILASDPDCVVLVDVAGEGLACTAIELPEPMDGDGRVAHSGDRLHYVSSDGESLKVWALDPSSSSSPPATPQWRLKHVVKVDDIMGGGCRRGDEVRFLALHPEKDAAYMWSPWRVVEYDLARREIAGEAWEFAGKGEKSRVLKAWLVPPSCHLTDGLLG